MPGLWETVRPPGGKESGVVRTGFRGEVSPAECHLERQREREWCEQGFGSAQDSQLGRGRGSECKLGPQFASGEMV